MTILPADTSGDRFGIGEQMAAESAAYRNALGVWKALSPGPWVVLEADIQNDLFKEIHAIACADRPVYDSSTVLLVVHDLVGGGFLIARNVPDEANGGRPGRLTEFTKAASAPDPDQRSWVERENEQLKKAHDRFVSDLEREANARAQAARDLRAPLETSRKVTLANDLEALGYVRRDQIEELVRDEVSRQVQGIADRREPHRRGRRSLRK